MSASSKKKLRNAQEAEKMTEKQLKEQKEAKKLKMYTTLFVVVLAVMIVFAAWTAISKTIAHSGIRERSTTAITVGDHQISNAELNFYFVDAAKSFYNNYGSYASVFGLNIYSPLDEQVLDEETGRTWADDFTESAINTAQAVYAMVDAANAANYTLSEEDIAAIDEQLNLLTTYASRYGYSDADDYVKAMYGNGASVELLREYYLTTALADAYQNYYVDNLDYDEAEIKAESEANYVTYCDYSYNYYYISANYFLTGGTTDEEGNTTYSDEEKAAAVEACEAAAKALAEGEYESVEEFDAAIAAMEINADSETTEASTARLDYAYSGVTESLKDWISDSSRKAGDITYIPSVTTSTDDAGNETKTVNGYYVAMYHSTNDNEYPLANVRHILISFEGGSYDSTTGTTVYSDEEKAAALTKAEALLAAWENGDATEESFAALANEESTDPGSNTVGGLYEDIYPGQMVTNFNDWCFAEGRMPGDTGIVETDYGYHVMFYSGASETTYRDYLITSTLQQAEYETWYTDLVEAMTITEGNTKYLSTDMVISGSY